MAYSIYRALRLVIIARLTYNMSILHQSSFSVHGSFKNTDLHVEYVEIRPIRTLMELEI